jgi:hypothetical protein
MMTAMTWGWLAAALALASGAPAAPVAPAEGAMRVVAEGTQSGITERKRVVVRTQEEWKKLWGAHAEGKTGKAAEPPNVDWSKEMVLAAFMGERPTGGFAVSIREPKAAEGKLQVTVVERVPGANPVIQVLTSPFQMAAVKRSDLPVEWKVETFRPLGAPPRGR